MYDRGNRIVPPSNVNGPRSIILVETVFDINKIVANNAVIISIYLKFFDFSTNIDLGN